MTKEKESIKKTKKRKINGQDQTNLIEINIKQIEDKDHPLKKKICILTRKENNKSRKGHK